MRTLPVFPVLLAMLGLAMWLPAATAIYLRDWEVARAFFYSGLFTAVWAGVMGFALSRPGGRRQDARRELAGLVGLWVTLPAFAALPLAMTERTVGLEGAYFEMVAAFTTTGGSVFEDPRLVSMAIHLWRGIVAWLGGLLTLMAAFAVMAPRRMGGFEVEAAALSYETGIRDRAIALGSSVAPLGDRIARARRVILPVYGAATISLASLLALLGQDPFVAAIHAMAIASTSGISPLKDGLAAVPDLTAEIAIALFLLIMATRRVYADASQVGRRIAMRHDPELKLMTLIIGLSVLGLFLRHWIGAIGIELTEPATDALAAIWGSFFTVLSFLTTTGFESAYWQSARDWSGWANPGLILLGLAAIGGGAATTAGGVKLIRAWTLMRHGMRELERIAQPSSIRGVGPRARGMMREGAVLVWAFIMLFIFALLATIFALTATGMRFDRALIAAISALANCGPAFAMVALEDQGFAALTGLERMILAAAMVLGRVETLVLIALYNPDAWSSRAARGSETTGKW